MHTMSVLNVQKFPTSVFRTERGIRRSGREWGTLRPIRFDSIRFDLLFTRPFYGSFLALDGLKSSRCAFGVYAG